MCPPTRNGVADVGRRLDDDDLGGLDGAAAAAAAGRDHLPDVVDDATSVGLHHKPH